jgi:BlaI family penicillinase repressor
MTSTRLLKLLGLRQVPFLARSCSKLFTLLKGHKLMAKDRELPPPLEMMCLNALWDIGEGNVEEVRKVVSQNRPLAYTTVLTLLDRLARRGAVSRRKEGRGFRYQPTVARDKLRRMALIQFLEYHFEGSVAKLRIFLEQPIEQTIEQPVELPVAQTGEQSIEPLPSVVSDAARGAPQTAPAEPAADSAFSAVVGGSTPAQSTPEA